MKIDLLEAFGIDQKLISLWKQKYAEELLPLQEKSVKEFNIFSGENIIVFAPTSSGKTFNRRDGCYTSLFETQKSSIFCSYAL
jgi:replicative superfamily II helicase